MGERFKIQDIKTPAMDTNVEATPLHTEVHKHAELSDIHEGGVATTRGEIISHYKVSENNVLVIPFTKGEQRKIRAFFVLKNKNNPMDSWYAEGNTAHAVLRNMIIEKAKMGVDGKALEDIATEAEFDAKWEIKKGFIDPFNNNFESFPNVKERLAQIQEERNLSSPPDWFISE